MKEWICREMSTSTSDNENGVLMMEIELIRCKDCKHYYEKEWVVGGGSYTTCWYQTIANAQPNDFCSRAERKEE